MANVSCQSGSAMAGQTVKVVGMNEIVVCLIPLHLCSLSCY